MGYACIVFANAFMNNTLLRKNLKCEISEVPYVILMAVWGI